MPPHGFRAGTRLVTLRGEVAVETIAPGDLVLTLFGHGAPLKPVIRAEALTLDPGPLIARPVRIAADAIEPGVPARDLLVASAHAIALEDAIGRRVLVPAHCLVNGASITRDRTAEPVTYVEVTLDTPELLMAEGLAAESAPPGEARAAPLLLGADSYELHASVLQTARDAGYSITDAPGITVLSGGVPAEVLDDTIFLLPPGPGPVTLRSRRFTPADVDPAGGDARELGICLARIVLDGTAIDLAGPACGDGFLPPEGEPWRWTTGEATLHLAPRDTESVLELILSPGLHGRYWLPPALTPR